MSPIDLIPEFVPVLGYVDDLVLISLGVLLVRAVIPSGVMEDCCRRAELAQGKLVSRAGLVIIVLTWIGLAAFGVWVLAQPTGWQSATGATTQVAASFPLRPARVHGVGEAPIGKPLPILGALHPVTLSHLTSL